MEISHEDHLPKCTMLAMGLCLPGFAKLLFLECMVCQMVVCIKPLKVKRARVDHHKLTEEESTGPPANKTAEADISAVNAHISSFPQYKSHYSRKSSPHNMFLSPSLSIQKMYRLYKKCEKDNKHPVSEWVYRKVFRESFNLAFGRLGDMHTHTHKQTIQHRNTT